MYVYICMYIYIYVCIYIYIYYMDAMRWLLLVLILVVNSRNKKLQITYICSFTYITYMCKQITYIVYIYM
jgi:hypothetical protein